MREKEIDYEIRVQEVAANIDLIKEIMENNLLVSEELTRLRAKEIEFGAELNIFAVSVISIGQLDLLQIYGEPAPEDSSLKVPSGVNEFGSNLGTGALEITRCIEIVSQPVEEHDRVQPTEV